MWTFEKNMAVWTVEQDVAVWNVEQGVVVWTVEYDIDWNGMWQSGLCLWNRIWTME